MFSPLPELMNDNMKRPSLYLLPIAFLVIPIGGIALLENSPLKMGQDEFERFFWSFFITIILDSLIMFFWMLALASKQPVYKPWKAILTLYLTIIIPAPILFFATLIRLHFYARWTGSIVVFIIVVGAFGFLFLGYKLLRSRLFSTYICANKSIWIGAFLIVGSVTVFLLSVLSAGLIRI